MQQFTLSDASSSNWIGAFDGFDDVMYKCRSAPIPELSTNPTFLGGGDIFNMYEGGNKVVFGDLVLEFMVDETYGNYKKLFDWLMSNASIGQADKKDITFKLLDQNGADQGINISYVDVFPTGLGRILLDTTSSENNLICSATLHFNGMEFV